jgi:hypothetical protein
VKPRWYGDKIKKCFLRIFYGDGGGGVEAECIGNHLNTKKETGAQ